METSIPEVKTMQYTSVLKHKKMTPDEMAKYTDNLGTRFSTIFYTSNAMIQLNSRTFNSRMLNLCYCRIMLL